GLASSVLAIGGLVGSILAAPGINTFGRKRILIMSAFVFGIAGLLKASAGGAVNLTIGRFLSGIAAGCAAVIVPIYINELAPPNYKGVF
ncbi:general substrate transporter, partial [Tuber brumale]